MNNQAQRATTKPKKGPTANDNQRKNHQGTGDDEQAQQACCRLNRIRCTTIAGERKKDG